MEYSLIILAGTAYGFLFGLIPVAGAGTALITVYSFIDLFRSDPYLLVAFTTAIVVAATLGDSFASVVMNIPGAGGSAATMVDGFPLAQQGQAARALSAAITTSTVNGLIWGAAVFLFLPFYTGLIIKFGIPEILSFLILAFCSVIFISNQYWFRGILALCLGIVLGLIGQDPVTGAERWTLGWTYLGNGIQFAPLLAGVLAFPELIEAYQRRNKPAQTADVQAVPAQLWQGIVDSWRHRWDGIRGGIIGAIVGVIPGIGGNVADWLAYGQTVAANRNEKTPFGSGNIKGVIGCEGANNSQKATSYVPTVLFGIPGAPFEVIIISLFMIVGLELGSPALLNDFTFFEYLTNSYMISMVLSFVVGMVFIRYAVLVTRVPFKYYFWSIMALLTWASVQYTGMWEDYVFFALCCVLGLLLKRYRLSRAALVVGFALADRLEGTTFQYLKLYDWTDMLTRPISGTIMALALAATVYGIFFNRSRINYT
jgi:putative tricarboxylic transport membrane protein